MVATTTTVFQQDTGMSRESTSPLSYIEFLVETPATADSGDTFTVVLAKYGMTAIKSIKEWKHTTNYSVMVPGTSTTSVTTGTLTVTLTGGETNLKRVFLIGGY